MRLIDADDVITAILYDEEHEETYNLKTTIADFLDSNTEEGCPQGIGWISVNDRLPEEKVWVLCLCRAGIREVLRWQNGQWYHDPQHAYFGSFVLYWMPLPEPPKE